MKKIINFLLPLILIGSANAQTRIILEKDNNIYHIPCQVNGLNMKFIFDSGASDVAISLTEALFMIKNNYLSEDNISGIKHNQIANGEIEEGTKVILNSINIGGYEIKNVEASITHNLKAPLLLGKSVLDRLGEFSFDYSTNSLIIGSSNDIRDTFGCISGNCFLGYGSCNFADGSKYIGEFKDGKKNGQGTETFANGAKYVGEFKNDKYNGQGTFTFPSGEKYVGEFKDGNLHGQGTMTFPSGEKYVGEYKDNKYNGQGTFTFPSGGKYVGKFKDDKKNGQGILTFANGTKYIGEFKDDNFHGQGTVTFPNGGKYVGEFKGGLSHGQGTLTLPSGEKYTGEFKDSKYNGQGTLTLPNGEKYTGEFKDGDYVK